MIQPLLSNIVSCIIHQDLPCLVHISMLLVLIPTCPSVVVGWWGFPSLVMEIPDKFLPPNKQKLSSTIWLSFMTCIYHYIPVYRNPRLWSHFATLASISLKPQKAEFIASKSLCSMKYLLRRGFSYWIVAIPSLLEIWWYPIEISLLDDSLDSSTVILWVYESGWSN